MSEENTLLGQDNTNPKDEGPAETSEPVDVLGQIPAEIREKAGIKSVDDVLEAVKERIPPKPDDYDLPEGWENFKEEAARIGLKPNQAKAVAEMFQKSAEEYDKQVQQSLQKLFDEWGEAKSANLGLAKKFVKQFDPDGELVEFLNVTKAGNNPVVIRFMYRVAKALDEQGYLKSESGTPQKPKDAASIMYPTMRKEE